MTLDSVEYDTTVHLIHEVVYEAPDQFGMRPTYRNQVDLWDEDSDRLDVRKAVAECPDSAWGWFTQQRFDARIVHDGDDVQLTSLPTKRSGTTFVDGHLVTLEEIEAMVAQQRGYVDERQMDGKAIGALPHGTDKRPILVALQNGEKVVLTRNGHYRPFDEMRGDSIVAAESQHPMPVLD